MIDTKKARKYDKNKQALATPYISAFFLCFFKIQCLLYLYKIHLFYIVVLYLLWQKQILDRLWIETIDIINLLYNDNIKNIFIMHFQYNDTLYDGIIFIIYFIKKHIINIRLFGCVQIYILLMIISCRS